MPPIHPMLQPRTLNRREAMLALGAGVGVAASPALFSPPSFAQSAVPAAAHHTIKLGQFEITVISDGTMALPLGFALPLTPVADVEALYAAHAQKLGASELTAQVNVAIVKTPGATIVIDCGGGTDFMPSMGRFADNFERAGIQPGSVTHVVFTHAHADHLWGVIDPLEDATRFPAARHVITAAEFDYWTKPGMEASVPDAMKGVAIGSARRLKSIGERFEKVKPGAAIAPGVMLVDTAGHTPGHVSVVLKSGSESLMIGGDVLTNPIVSFACPDWPWGPDTDRDLAIASRKRTLDMLATDKMALLGYHMPWPGIGRVERKDTAYRFVQV